MLLANKNIAKQNACSQLKMLKEAIKQDFLRFI